MRETHKNYGFVPNFAISTHLNARHVLGKTPTGAYFAHFTNKQFHDHTTKKIIPAAASTVLGVGLKFIPLSVRMTLMKLSSDSAMIFTSKYILPMTNIPPRTTNPLRS